MARVSNHGSGQGDPFGDLAALPVSVETYELAGGFYPLRGRRVRIEVRFKDEVSILSLSGRFIAGSDGPFLRQKVKDLLDAGTTKLLLDFADVPYIDSTGLGFLAGARVTAQNAGIPMVLASLNPHVRRVLDEVKLSQFFVIAEDEAAALTRLREATSLAGDAQDSEGKARKAKKRSLPAAES